MKAKIFVLFVMILVSIADTSFAYDIKIKVTSYIRTPKEQAVLMVNDYNRGVNLYYIYKNTKIIKEIIGVMKSDNVETAVTAIIEKYASEGEYLSYHMCGKALDISKRGRNVKDLIAFMVNLEGTKVIDEGDHYHIQTVTKCN